MPVSDQSDLALDNVQNEKHTSTPSLAKQELAVGGLAKTRSFCGESSFIGCVTAVLSKKFWNTQALSTKSEDGHKNCWAIIS